MQTNPRGPGQHTLRLLVVIASYGNRNDECLRFLIDQYRSMSFDVDVVVLSNIPKSLGTDVEVIVGLPADHPWSLPFGHREVFARNVDTYDLFAYSEDDMAVTEANIRAFVRISPELAPDEIAGFLRFEVDKLGAASLPDIHSGYRWKPHSVQHRGAHTVAEFTNDHAAFYLLTQDQLRSMIAFDGFLRAPYEGRYDMLCSAATDIYTNYGKHKVVCISALDDFLIHHRSNRYAGRVGVGLSIVRQQVAAMLDIAAGRLPACTLLQAESPWPQSAWAKDYYEQPNPHVLALVPSGARTVLSIGCGWGATEELLQARGARVTAIPIDAVFGVIAAARGLDVEIGTFDDCLARLADRQFDCVVLNDLLHLLPDPYPVVQRCARLVRAGGSLVLGGPNFHSLRVRAKRLTNRGGYRRLRSFLEGGIHVVGPHTLAPCLHSSGFDIAQVRWPTAAYTAPFEVHMGRWGAAAWVLQARQLAAQPG